jgi:hypothetical protein
MRERNNTWQRANKAARTAQKIACVVKSRQERPAYAWLKAVKERSSRLGWEFDLTLDDVPVPEFCPILGIPLVSRMGNGGKLGGHRDNAPSIDRIDNDRGYVRGNVVVISYRANRIKSDANMEELRKIVAFYDGLSLSTDRKPGDSNRSTEARREQDFVSEVLASQIKETGSVPFGENR